jgi:hypothetical protein
MKSDGCARVGLAAFMWRAVFFALIAIAIAIAVDVHLILVPLALAPHSSHLGDHHRAFLYTARVDARFGQVGCQVSERAEARGAREVRLVLHLLFPLRLHLVAKRNLCRRCFTLVIRVNLPTNVFNLIHSKCDAASWDTRTHHVFVVFIKALSLEHLLFAFKCF